MHYSINFKQPVKLFVGVFSIYKISEPMIIGFVYTNIYNIKYINWRDQCIPNQGQIVLYKYLLGKVYIQYGLGQKWAAKTGKNECMYFTG